MSEYTVDYFIEKFENTLEGQWIIGERGHPDTGACAIGHCFSIISKEYDKRLDALAEILSRFRLGAIGDRLVIAQINDGRHPDFQQNSPRKRILAALTKAKKMELNGL